MDLLSFLKIAGILLACGFGVYGITHEFKIKGRLTRPGKIAILGGIVSALVSITTQIIENKNGELAQYNEKRNARKPLELIQDYSTIRVDISYWIDADNPLFSKFTSELDKISEKYLRELRLKGKSHGVLKDSVSKTEFLFIETDDIQVLTIKYASPLFPPTFDIIPTNQAERLLDDLLNVAIFQIDFENCESYQRGFPLTFFLGGRLDGRLLNNTSQFNESEILYDQHAGKKQLHVVIKDIPLDQMGRTSKVREFLSVVDFEDSRATITFPEITPNHIKGLNFKTSIRLHFDGGLGLTSLINHNQDVSQEKVAFKTWMRTNATLGIPVWYGCDTTSTAKE